MSTALYQRLSSLFFSSILIVCLFIVTSQVLILYLLSPNIMFYYLYIALLFIVALSGIKFCQNYYGFKETLSQGLLNAEPKPEPSLTAVTEQYSDEMLEVCKYYANGGSINHITDTMRFNHPEQTRRELMKGIGFLLRFYSENERKTP